MRRLAVALVVLLAACGGSDSSTAPTTTPPTTPAATSPRPTAPPTTPPEATAPPTTVEHRDDADDPAVIFDGLLDDEGYLGVDSALSLFAATYAPLPGVEPAAVPADHHDSVVLGELAGNLDQLTDEQLAIVERIIGAPPSVQGFAGRSPASAPPGTQAIVDHAVAYFEGRLGITMDQPIEVVGLPYENDDGTRNFSSPDVGASSQGTYDSRTFIHTGCLVRINLDSPHEGATATVEIGHEIFHCFQKRWHGRTTPPLWVIEGQAAFAGNDYGGSSPYTAGWWARWVDQPERDLYTRSYDAVGLFELANARGHSPYAFASQIVGTPTIEQFNRLTGGVVADAWAKHYANESPWGAEYTISGIDAPSRGAPRSRTEIAPGTAADIGRLTAPSTRSAVGADVAISSDVAVVRLSPTNSAGVVRFGDGSEFGFTTGVDICVQMGGCECPDETPEHVDAATDYAFVGWGGDIGDAEPSLTGLDLDTWCPDADDPCDPTDPAATIPAECEPDLGDECYHGEWVADPEQVAAHAEVALTAATGGFGTYESGDIVIVIRGDGTYSQQFEDVSISGPTPDGVVRNVSNQRVDGNYEVAGNSLMITATNLHLSDDVTIDGVGPGPIVSDLALPAETSTIEFACGGDNLTFSSWGPFPTDFTRRR